MKEKKRLTLDEKIEEAYKLCVKGIIPKSTDDIVFSDGINVGIWLNSYKDYLKNISKRNNKAKILYEEREKIISNRHKEHFNEIIIEFTNILMIYPEVLSQDLEVTLSTGRNANNWIKCNRKRVFILANNGNEYAINLVESIQQIKPDYFDFIDVVKNRMKQKQKKWVEYVQNR